jgi:site-specific DNA-methyltransferase (adenine-specific)
MVKEFEKGKLYKGDCLEVMKDIADKSVDMILCDLPYGTTACKWDTIIPLEPLWEQYKRVIKQNGAIILTGVQPFTSALIMSNPKMFKHEWIWHKSKCGSAFTSKYRPQQKHENVLVFGSGKTTYNPQMVAGKPYYRKRKGNDGSKPNNHNLGVTSDSETINTGFRYPETVQFFQQKWRRQDQIHPTQKPIELMEYLIRTYSNEDEIVLDNCSGSGTTGIAAINTNRKFILIEQDENYFDLSSKRIEEHIENG